MSKMSELDAMLNERVDHVDDFIDYHFGKDVYARWVLSYFRMPAVLKLDFWEIMKDHKLFCTYEGKRMRCTGASRMGDVWLAKDPKQEIGYDLRVCVSDCKEWGATYAR